MGYAFMMNAGLATEKLYVVGGYDSSSMKNTFAEFDGTNTWA
jgi:hypothetical protein